MDDGKAWLQKVIPVYILTNDKHLWLLPGFCYLWNKYTNRQPATVIGFKEPDRLPRNIYFTSLGQQLPARQWSDGLLALIERTGDKYFILMLEDFWLYEPVDFEQIGHLSRMMNDDILRIDLSGNRASYKQARAISLNLVETPEGTPYQMSFQAAIWHRDNLKSVLVPGENPWQAEVNGCGRVGSLRVLGTKQAVLKYQPVWRTNQKRWQLDRLKTDDLELMRARGWITEKTN